MTKSIPIQFLTTIRELSQSKGISELLQDEFVANICSHKSKRDSYDHSAEAGSFLAHVNNFYNRDKRGRDNQSEIMNAMKKDSYPLIKMYINIIEHGLSWSNAKHFFLRKGSDWTPSGTNVSVGLTSYGMRQAIENMRDVLIMTEGILVRRWHDFEYDVYSQKITHKFGIEPEDITQKQNETVGVYSYIKRKDSEGNVHDQVIFIDKKRIDNSLEDALKNLDKIGNAEIKGKQKEQRSRFADVYTKRLPYFEAYKVYFDLSRVDNVTIANVSKMDDMEELVEESSALAYDKYSTKPVSKAPAQKVSKEEEGSVEAKETPSNDIELTDEEDPTEE